MLTDRFDEAFHYAHRLHRSQTRKGTSIPYISHLMTVAALVVEHGGNEDQAIGAWRLRFSTSCWAGPGWAG
jgi:(p)ppGpp synthase/HD superfamily hydrolase